MQDLSIEIAGTFLNIRVAGIIRTDDKILVSKWREDRLSLIGGRVKIGETTQAALVREVTEETGLRVVASQLHAIVDKVYHEFLYVYDVETDNFQLNPSAVDFQEQKTLWQPLSEVHKLRPAVLEQVVTDDKHEILHIVNRDEKL